MIWAFTLLLLTAADPRPGLVELQQEGDVQAALEKVGEALETEPELGLEIGLPYLEGHLLESLGRSRDAHGAFVRSMGSNPRLEPYSRYRLAINQLDQGHPEVAAGLLATLLARRPPRSLAPVAARLLADAVEAGGDCRLLAAVDTWRIPDGERRLLQVVRADCALAKGETEEARQLLMDLLRTSEEDEPARGAAQRIAELGPAAEPTDGLSLLLGMTFHRHRQFGAATRYLEQGLSDPVVRDTVTTSEILDAGYALARAYFWQEEYAVAAVRFGELAGDDPKPDRIARAFYQQGRSVELHGDWTAASASYRRAYSADPTGEWAAAALISGLRVEWRGGREDSALELYGLLGTRRSFRSLQARAALFLASSDLVRGQADRAGEWLTQAEAAVGRPTLETRYWRGRLAELAGEADRAVVYYMKALREDRQHPLAQRIGERLALPELAGAARSEGLKLAGSSRVQDLHGAWLLLDDETEDGARVRDRMVESLSRDPGSRAFLELTSLPPTEWPLWEKNLTEPEELLLALGIVERDPSAVRRHFPLDDISVGFTGSEILADSGLYRPSLYAAEVLEDKKPESLPLDLTSIRYRDRLYPFPYRQDIVWQSSRFGVDPYLLVAIIREESRFDPQAISGASARGLTQFILPTAELMVEAIGLERIEARDLHRPEISIGLGAAYLARLAHRFENRAHVAVAAYNAGENQAQLWQSYCYSAEPEEYYTKVGFSQTRGYLRKVLSSRGHYSEIYRDRL